MSNDSPYKIYTAKEIAAYLSGEMPNHQRHAMEKAALDDPLLADAIEGYESVNETDWTAALIELKGKITTAEKVPVVSISKRESSLQWKAAAVVILLLSGFGLTYLFTNREQPVILAEQHAEVKSLDSISSEAPANIAIPVLPGNMEEASSTAKALAEKSGTKKYNDSDKVNVEVENEAEAKNDFVYTPGKKLADKPSTNLPLYKQEDIANNNPSVADNTRNESSPLSNQANASNAIINGYSKQIGENKIENDDSKLPASNANYTNHFSGFVVAKDNTPVAFARINISGRKEPVYTDKNGYFKITSSDTIINGQVYSAGYASKDLTFKPGETSQRLVLEPVSVEEQKLSSNKISNAEIVVSKSKREQQKEIEDQEAEEATPVNGWEEYNNYLSANGNIGNKNIHGVVEVFVKLDKSGSVSTIKVDKSLCAECDAEAVRLVKEGPKWVVKTNKARKVKVKIRF